MHVNEGASEYVTLVQVVRAHNLGLLMSAPFANPVGVVLQVSQDVPSEHVAQPWWQALHAVLSPER